MNFILASLFGCYGKTYQARKHTSILFDTWKEAFAPNSSFTYGGQSELVQFHNTLLKKNFSLIHHNNRLKDFGKSLIFFGKGVSSIFPEPSNK